MKLPPIRTSLFIAAILFTLFYLAKVFIVATDDRSVEALWTRPVMPEVVALFGASGTAGDGILKVALADPDVSKIHVITRRATARIQEGIASGKVQMTQHMDYLDYQDIREQLSEVDTVYWAIGTSSLGVDKETYGRIHVDFPMQFVREWIAINRNSGLLFQFISSSDISEDSSSMWVREKIRAEKSLFSFADGSNLRVIAYRPDYIGSTRETAHFGQNLMYWFFNAVRAAVKATDIGRGMLVVSARGSRIENGTTTSTANIIRFSHAYCWWHHEARQLLSVPLAREDASCE